MAGNTDPYDFVQNDRLYDLTCFARECFFCPVSAAELWRVNSKQATTETGRSVRMGKQGS